MSHSGGRLASERARAHFTQSLPLAQELGSGQLGAAGLAGIAGAAGATGRPAQAGRLFGAAGRLAPVPVASLLPADRLAHDHNLTAAQGQIDAAAWAAAWAAGAALSLEVAVTRALALRALPVEPAGAGDRTGSP